MPEETVNGTQPVARAALKRAPEPKFIVLDANVLIADYWLRSPSVVLLRDFLKKSKATLVVPRIVFDEVLNHHKEDLARVKSDIRKSMRDAERLVRGLRGQLGSILTISKKSAEDPYEKFLTAELGSLGAKIPDYAEIPHEEIVHRDLQRRKPFQESGKGYRDTLLWETLLRSAIEKGAVSLFITRNTRDFCDPEGQLHKDLQPDVIARSGDKSSLILFRDLPNFTDTYIVPYLTKRKDFVVLVENNKVPGLELKDVCERNIDSLITALNRSPSVMIGNPGQYEPEVDTIELPSSFQVEEASEVSENVLLVLFEFEAEVYFTYFLPHIEYALMPDEESAAVEVLDPDWNEYVMRVETVRTVQFSCRITFNAGTEEVESFEVEDVTS